MDLAGVPACDPDCTIDLFVENLGRANFGKPHELNGQLKGLVDEVLIDGVPPTWEIIALEMKNDFVRGLQGWQPYDLGQNSQYAPRVLRGSFEVSGSPQDTFFDYNCAGSCQQWLHGAFYVNGFNMGRYYTAGPTGTLYIPAPFLQSGTNEVYYV